MAAPQWHDDLRCRLARSQPHSLQLETLKTASARNDGPDTRGCIRQFEAPVVGIERSRWRRLPVPSGSIPVVVQGEFAYWLSSCGIYHTATQDRPGRQLRLLFDCRCGL